MSNTSLAQPTRTVPEEVAERILRGQELYREHSTDFEHQHGAWLITSDNVSGRTYEVRLGPIETCECGDYQYRGSRCKHIMAASIADAKSRVCSCCGQRVLSRFTTEVQEDAELLSWFVGDVICADCISEGFWA